MDDSNVIIIIIGFLSLIGGIVTYSVIHTIWGILFVFLGLVLIGLGGYAVYEAS